MSQQLKEPPDKYKCIKVPLHKIIKLKNQTTFNTINNAVYRTNIITTKAYMLIRLWILEKYHNNIDIPHITLDTIKMAFKSIVKSSSGPKPKGNNLQLYEEFKKLYTFDELENGLNLSSVLDYYATSMITAIENNIKMHFFDYVNRYINSIFKHKYKKEVENKDFKKQLFKDLKKLKTSIIDNTEDCDEKFKEWLKGNRNKIVPKEFDTNYYYDVKANPQKYLKYMIYMNLELEKIEGKMFQFFPLQTQIIPKHIQIDTKGLIELFVMKEKETKDVKDTNTDNHTKEEYLNNIEKYKEFLWDKYFDIKVKVKHYIFDYCIITDGYATSIRFLHNNYIESVKESKLKKKQGKDAVKGLTKEEKDILKNEKNKKLIVEKEEKSKGKNKKSTILIKEDKPKYKDEFPYIDDVDTKDLTGKHIFIDPGKRDLFKMMDDEGNFMTYSNRMRIFETKRLKYQSLLKNYKDKLKITEKENKLSSYNFKICNFDKFKKCIDEKLKVNKEVYQLYQDIKFRQYKLYSYINTKRSEDNMLNKIEKKYSKDHIIIIGDWSIGKQMKNFISTPNIGLKRKLKERFNVYNIDEFRTSCLSHKTEDKCENLYQPDKNNKSRKLHAVLTYQMENKRIGCVNRDKNSCYNIKKIFDSYLTTGKRPEKYCRDYKLE